jgi:hypothetical protein
MNEKDLRRLIEKVRSGRMSRRRFIEGMVGLGLTVPMAGHLLMHSGVANAQSKFNYKPTKRGGGGALKLLMWQGPTLLNPHFAVGRRINTRRASSTSRLPDGMATATSSSISPPRFRPSRTAGSRRTACRSPGSSRRT